MKRLAIIVFVFGFSVYSWGQITVKNDITAAYIAPNGALKKNFEVSSGAFVFDATKRMGISNIFQKKDGSYMFKYLGEEQPDAVYETLKDFLAEAGANIGTQEYNVEVAHSVENLVKSLTEKSKAHTFLRSSLYRVNEALFNEDIQEESYQLIFLKIIETAKEIQLAELGVIKIEEAENNDPKIIKTSKE